MLLAVMLLTLMTILVLIMIYIFAAGETRPAVAFVVRSVVVGVSDNLLRPILLEGSIDILTLVISVGARHAE